MFCPFIYILVPDPSTIRILADLLKETYPSTIRILADLLKETSWGGKLSSWLHQLYCWQVFYLNYKSYLSLF